MAESAADLDILVANQRQELMAASSAEADLDLAFRLQMEEALAASASLSASSPILASSSSSSATASHTSSSTTLSVDADLLHALNLQTTVLEHYQQERHDAELSRKELRRASENLLLRAHDEKLAREINEMSDDEWDATGDNFERPIELHHAEEELPFLLYFKGMMREEQVRGASVKLAGIGVAVCGPKGDMLLKIQKPVPVTGSNREGLEVKALIEGLNVAIELGIKNLDVYFDFMPLLNHVNGKWKVKQRNIENLIGQVHLLQRKLDKCRMFLLPRCSVQFVFQLASEVIDSQMTKCEDLILAKSNNNLKETCNICLEITDCSQMFSILGCGHRFCISCMQQHIEVKLLHGMLPNCPHEGCKIKLEVESCRKFLLPKLVEVMRQRIKEESIPPNEKIYCPFPRCSALMSKRDPIPPVKNSPAQKNIIVDNSGLRKCVKCSRCFCMNCKAPWHERLSCYQYKMLNPHHNTEDVRLQTLARQKLWRQCVKCSHMIELAEGCYHMTCRCGYEFCYTCGAEWRNKSATCSCPLWDEQYIIAEDSDEESDDGDYYYDEDSFDEYDENDDDHYGNVRYNPHNNFY